MPATDFEIVERDEWECPTCPATCTKIFNVDHVPDKIEYTCRGDRFQRHVSFPIIVYRVI